ncbi:MAG: hypothetical protein V7L20_00975 [Nostoc sp.]|uniref:hypothetical protein n=1 Tax=Nostoc sp. TaxID=1180 RepID=UPI002FFBCD92
MIETTLFTTLSPNEEANLSGGNSGGGKSKYVKIKAGAGGGAGSGGTVFGDSGSAVGGDGIYSKTIKNYYGHH